MTRTSARPGVRRSRLALAGPATYDRIFRVKDIEISRAGAALGREVTAYCAVFDEPVEINDVHGHYMEQIARTAFNRQLGLGTDHVGVYYHHGMTLHGTPSDLGSVPIGSPVSIRADKRGLLTVSRFNESELATSVLRSIENGDIKGYSFRGAIHGSNPQRPAKRRPGEPLPMVTRTGLGLTEYGPTPTPYYQSAGIMAVRSATALLEDLDEEGKELFYAELLRVLSPSTPAAGDEDPDGDFDEDGEDQDDDDPTSDAHESEPGAEDQPEAQRHSGRQHLKQNVLEVARTTAERKS